jgi:hypothetical protein
VAVVVELVYVALFEKSNVFFVTIGRSFFFWRSARYPKMEAQTLFLLCYNSDYTSVT